MAKKKTRKKTRKQKPKVKNVKQAKTKFSKSTLTKFKKMLLVRKKFIMDSMSHMKDGTLTQSRKEASGDLSNMPIHMADIGSDTYEQDFTLGLLENEGEEIQEIDLSLERINDKTYGVCELCQKSISESRLKAIPYTRLCIPCKEKEESRG